MLTPSLCMKFSIRCLTASNSPIPIIAITFPSSLTVSVLSPALVFHFSFFGPFFVTNLVIGRSDDMYGPVLFVVLSTTRISGLLCSIS